MDGTREGVQVKLKLILVSAFIFYLIPYLIIDQIFSPDEVDYLFFGKLLSEEGRLSFVSPYDDLFGLKGFIPRHFTYNKFGEVVSQGFQGLILLMALFRTLLPDSLIFMINPLLAVFALFLVYKISCVILTDRGYALWSTLFLATTPIFIHWTNFYMPDMLNVTLFLAAFLCLLKVLNAGEVRYYLGLGLCSGLLYWVRYTSVLLLVPLAFLVLVRRSRLHLGGVLLSTMLFLIIIGLGLTYHFSVYGTMFEWRNENDTAFYLEGEPETEEQRQSPVVTELMLRPALYRLKTAPAIFSIAYPPFFLALLGLFLGWQNKSNRDFVLFFVLLFIVVFLSVVFFWTYGFTLGELTLQSSFLRYLLPVFVFLPIATSIALSSFKGPTAQIAVVVTLVNLCVAVIGPHGILESIVSKIYFQKTAEFILGHTDEKTVVISSYWDKVVYPQRITYGHVNRLQQAEFDRLVKNIFSAGFKIAYVDHERNHNWDRQTTSHTLHSDQVKHVQGPLIESGAFRMIRKFIPPDLYPVHMYLVEASDSQDGNVRRP